MKWLKTKSGIPFVCAGTDAFVFYVARSIGDWAVAWCGSKKYDTHRYVCCDDYPAHSNPIPRRWCECGRKVSTNCGIACAFPAEERAQEYAVGLAIDMGGNGLDELTASNHPPTHAQVIFARSLGIEIPGRTTDAGVSVPSVTITELSDMIIVEVASRQIDEKLAPAARTSTVKRGQE